MSVKAFEALSVSSSSTGFTSATYGSAVRATCRVSGDRVRMRADGTAPTSTVGIILEPGDVVELESADEIARVQFIRINSDATVTAHFFV